MRMGIAAAMSVGVTFLLFFIMQELVKPADELNLEKPNDFQFVDIVQNIEETPPQAQETKVERPPEVEAPPPEIEVPDVEFEGPDGLNMSVGPANNSIGTNLTGLDLGPSQDGDYLPLARVQPQYPRRAQQRGVEGYVIVELTVEADGSVDPNSIIIVEAEPTGYFENAAKKAAARFKYKPKVVNGEGVPVAGVSYKFSFNLADDGRRR